MLKGIDISAHNGAIDFGKIKVSGLADFVIIRAGYGKLISQKDKRFEEYYKNCKDFNIPCGAYWYSYAESVSEIQTEARVFLEVIKGKKFEYPVYLDFEEQSQFALGKAKCSEMAKAFLDIVESARYYVGLYSSKSQLENYFTEDVLRRYTIWVAHYGVTKTSYEYPYDMWQYSSTGSVSGISHSVDMNYCYKPYFSKLIKALGLNGFTKEEKPETNHEHEQSKKSIKVSAWIDDHEYSGLLEED